MNVAIWVSLQPASTAVVVDMPRTGIVAVAGCRSDLVTTCAEDVCVSLSEGCAVTIEDGITCPSLGEFAADARLSLIPRRDATCVDISVCDGFSGSATVCIGYADSDLDARQRERLKVIKCASGGACQVLDPVSNDGETVCG